MANIVLPFVTTYDDKGAKSAEKSLLGLSKTSVLSAISVGAVVDQLGKAVRAAADDRKEQDLLRNAIQNNTDATSAQAAEVEKTIGKMQFQKAVSDGELRPAMGNLVRATQDVTKAQELLGLALDISAGTGKDLQTVSIALAKAQTGNIGALTRLGIPLDATAVKSKDLAAIYEDLAGRFAGASDAAANSASGGMKKLQIALDETYEKVGNALIPVLEDYVIVLGDLAQKSLNAEGSTKGLSDRFIDFLKVVSPVGQLIKGLQTINGLVADQADKLNQVNQVTSRVTNGAKEQESINRLLEQSTKKNTQADENAVKAKDKAREAAKKYADTLRDRVKTALDATSDAVAKAQGDFDDYRNSLIGTIEASISLSDAFKTQKQADEGIAEALRDRATAYAELKKLDPKEDAERYAEALQKVADAEENVRVAADKRKTASTEQVFADQIANAREFAQNLQYLIEQHGLGQAGLAQLINLGVDAGNEVTRAMIFGTSGITAKSLNESLGSISQAAASFGTASANAFFGGALNTALGNQQAVNQYNITVNAGLVSNPAQVGRDIIEAIKQAERLSGIVFAPA